MASFVWLVLEEKQFWFDFVWPTLLYTPEEWEKVCAGEQRERGIMINNHLAELG